MSLSHISSLIESTFNRDTLSKIINNAQSRLALLDQIDSFVVPPVSQTVSPSEETSLLTEIVQAYSNTVQPGTPLDSVETLINNFINQKKTRTFYIGAHPPDVKSSKAVLIEHCPQIKLLMEELNDGEKYPLNSCLINILPDSASIRAHSDNEGHLDPKAPIYVLALGSSREVEFTS